MADETRVGVRPWRLSFENVFLAAWLALGLVVALAVIATAWPQQAFGKDAAAAMFATPSPATMMKLAIPLATIWVVAAPLAVWRLERKLTFSRP